MELACRAYGVVGLMLIFCGISLAQGGPPMITDDTATVSKGHFEINTGFTMEFDADGRLWAAPLIDFNYGTSNRTQINVVIPYLVLHNNGQPGVRAFGNTNVSLKWRFRDGDEKGRLSVSVDPRIAFNTPGSDAQRLGIVERGPAFQLPLQFEMHWAKTGVNGNVGYRFKRGEDEIFYGVLLGREFKRFDLLAEIAGIGTRRHFDDRKLAFNLGTRIPITKHAAWMMSAGRSLRPGHDPTFIGYAGVQWTF